jgi:DNA-binding transcriptional MerR regulator
MTEARYSIKDLEQLTGIKAHTLRIWEKRYGLVIPKRTNTNIRYYSDQDLKKLLNIAILNRHGVKISKIAKLENNDLNNKIISVTSKANDTDSQIENLVIAMIELDENMFEKILTTSIINHGFEDTYLKILFPLFERIGILWQIGTINPGQEHFISNLIRQKMIVAIDGLVAPINKPGKKSFVLFLPEDELHEIGLLFYSYMLQKQGHQVIYLGQMLPFDDLISIVSAQNPDALLTIFTSPVIKNDIESYVKKMALTFAKQQIFVSGRQFKLNQYNIPKKIQLIESFDQLREYV